MIDSLSPFIGIRNNYSQIIPAARAAGSVEAQQEFLTIFYKELLKQAFKAPDLSLGENEQENSNFLSAFNSDLMVEQLARQLATSGSFNPDWISLYGTGK